MLTSDVCLGMFHPVVVYAQLGTMTGCVPREEGGLECAAYLQIPIRLHGVAFAHTDDRIFFRLVEQYGVVCEP
jgi:hypothetical protein